MRGQVWKVGYHDTGYWYLLSLESRKNPEVTDLLKKIPGVAWMPELKYWVLPIEMLSLLKANVTCVLGSHIPFNRSPRVFQTTGDPKIDNLYRKFPASQYTNPKAQRTIKRANDEILDDPWRIYSADFDPWTHPEKMFSILEILYPYRVGRLGGGFGASFYRWKERYCEFEETRWGNRMTGRINPEHLDEYVMRINAMCKMHITAPDSPESPIIIEKGLFQ